MDTTGQQQTTAHIPRIIKKNTADHKPGKLLNIYQQPTQACD